MTKQVHIHIHRTKARDAGEGEGKWITLSPSGTHVKIDKGGEITAGPEGMTGKKPSELSKGASGSPKPIKHATGQGQSFLPTQPKMGHGSVTKTGSGFTAKNHKGFKEYFKPHEEEKAKAYAASGKEDTPHDPTGMAHAGRPQGTAAVQARIDAKKAAGKPAVNASSLKEGQALYDKSGQKVDEVESIQRRTLGKGLTINTRAGYQVHVDESGANAQGWTNEKGPQGTAAMPSAKPKGSAGPATTKTESDHPRASNGQFGSGGGAKKGIGQNLAHGPSEAHAATKRLEAKMAKRRAEAAAQPKGPQAPKSLQAMHSAKPISKADHLDEDTVNYVLGADLNGSHGTPEQLAQLGDRLQEFAATGILESGLAGYSPKDYTTERFRNRVLAVLDVVEEAQESGQRPTGQRYEKLTDSLSALRAEMLESVRRSARGRQWARGNVYASSNELPVPASVKRNS